MVAGSSPVVPSHKVAVYRNTPKNAAEIGWKYVPEYCEGNPCAEFVIHCPGLGVYIFTDEGEFVHLDEKVRM